MKINKSRLLQIIREEVELHEENTFELDESDLEEVDVSRKQFSAAIDNDQEENGLAEFELEENGTTDEDRLFTKQKPHKIIDPKNNREKLEIKLK